MLYFITSLWYNIRVILKKQDAAILTEAHFAPARIIDGLIRFMSKDNIGA